jgi:hypothetical protein
MIVITLKNATYMVVNLVNISYQQRQKDLPPDISQKRLAPGEIKIKGD